MTRTLMLLVAALAGCVPGVSIEADDRVEAATDASGLDEGVLGQGPEAAAETSRDAVPRDDDAASLADAEEDTRGGDDVAIEAPTPDGCALTSGAAECERYVDAWCKKLVGCCPPSACGTRAGCHAALDGTCSVDACRAWVTAHQIDCSTVTALACPSLTNLCISDVGLELCGFVVGGTLPAQCQTFLAQF